MKAKWRYFLVSILLVMVIGLSATSMLYSGTDETKYQISVIVENSAGDRWTPFEAGLEQAAEDRNIRLNLVSTGEFQNLSEERQMIENELQSGADGIITQLYSSSGTADMITEISRRAALELVDTDADAEVDVEGKYAAVMPDNNAIGRAIGNELMINYGDKLKGKKIGLISGNQKQYALQKRLDGFISSIENSGASVVWVEDGSGAAEERLEYRQKKVHADIIVAMENDGLEHAVDYLSQTKDKADLYGEGCSDKNVYYLDYGTIHSMIVPNEYNMGYQAVVSVADRLDNKLTPMKDHEISYRVVHKDNMYDTDNQKLLFPIIQ